MFDPNKNALGETMYVGDKVHQLAGMYGLTHRAAHVVLKAVAFDMLLAIEIVKAVKGIG